MYLDWPMCLMSQCIFCLKFNFKSKDVSMEKIEIAYFIRKQHIF